MLLFYYFLKYQLIKIVAKGVRVIDCFEQKDNSHLEFADFKSKSSTGIIPIIAKKTDYSIQEIKDKLFQWYSEDRIKLVNSPSKCIFYSYEEEITDQQADEIYNEIQERLDYRIENFETFITLIESDTSPEKIISQYLNIN